MLSRLSDFWWLTFTTDAGREWRQRADLIEGYWPATNFVDGFTVVRTTSGKEQTVRESLAAIDEAFARIRQRGRGGPE